ncbi:hypothetical protein QFX71_001778 [Citrobacter amalonaticus]|nr:hypothetical protein [Citrobacter amalonaticus]
MQINQLQIVKQALLEAMQANSEPEPDDINKSAQNVLDDAIDAYITNSNKTLAEQKADAYTAFTESGGKDLLPLYQVGASTVKTMKKKGIAITHQAQNYSANNRPVSLMMKAGVDLNTLTPEQREILKRLGHTLNGEQGA